MDDRSYNDGLKIVIYFARMRWLAIFFIAYFVLHLKFISLLDFPLTPCLLIIIFGSAYNALNPYLVRFFRSFPNWVAFIYITGTLDLLCATILIHYTGGVSSPLVYLYFILLISGSIFGFTMLDYFLSCQLTIFFMVTCVLEGIGFIPHYPLGLFFGQSYSDFRYLSAAAASLFLACLLVTYIASYLAKQILENQKKIAELSSARVEFIDQVVHEIKSPLTSIIGYTELLAKEKLGALCEAQKEPMNVVERQSRRILDMVNDLLNLSRLESGMLKLEKKPVSIVDLATRAIEEASPMINSQKIQLIQEFDPGLPQLLLDEAKIHEVFTNLISNAIKFCSDGSRIFISITLAKDTVLVAVRDEGLGIDPVDLPHIFERFYRASKESAQRKGTGLGLAISKSIIEAHGGRMWAVSAGVGKGAVLYFALPLPA
jgi:signal transduction histidine kinase